MRSFIELVPFPSAAWMPNNSANSVRQPSHAVPFSDSMPGIRTLAISLVCRCNLQSARYWVVNVASEVIAPIAGICEYRR